MIRENARYMLYLIHFWRGTHTTHKMQVVRKMWKLRVQQRVEALVSGPDVIKRSELLLL